MAYGDSNIEGNSTVQNESVVKNAQISEGSKVEDLSTVEDSSIKDSIIKESQIRESTIDSSTLLMNQVDYSKVTLSQMGDTKVHHLIVNNSHTGYDTELHNSNLTDEHLLNVTLGGYDSRHPKTSDLSLTEEDLERLGKADGTLSL